MPLLLKASGRTSILLAFCRYFVRYVLSAKTRQWPLFLAGFGLLLSAFALMVLQGTMSGFQAKQIERAKRVQGIGVIHIAGEKRQLARGVLKELSSQGLRGFLELRRELLLRTGNQVRPVLVHALEPHLRPDFLVGTDGMRAVLPWSLASSLGIGEGEQFELISPTSFNHFLGEVPRSVGVTLGKTIVTDVPEVDILHIWVRLGLLQNLIAQRAISLVRIFPGEHSSLEGLREILEKRYSGQVRLVSWEERHKTLMWSLALESAVMLFLFVSMGLLVGVCIVGGLSILYGKVRDDFAAFWILGADKIRLERANIIFWVGVSLLCAGVGLLAGLGVLHLIDLYGGEVFSEEFIDQKIPVHITLQGILISFFVPCGICLFFCHYTFRQFKRDTNYLDRVRASGA